MQTNEKQNQKCVIIRTDGGICSQIQFCALGKHFEDLGYKVKYDTTWFDNYGTGIDGLDVRNYDIAKAFPSLTFETASKEEIKLYKEKYNVEQMISKLQDKMYVCGYPAEREQLFLKYKDYFKQHFNPVDKSSIAELVNNIESKNSCAVHVRRGDLANYNPYYGNPADADYFLKAIKLVTSLNDNVKVFFFSDDMQWVKDNIIPKLDKNCDYELMENNDSSKGYLDLYLISRCKHIVASNGSFGIMGKILATIDTTLIMSKPKDVCCRHLENIYIINKPKTIENAIAGSYFEEYKKYKKKYKVFSTITLILSILSVLLIGILVYWGVN